MLIYINGEFVEHESAKISLHDRGFLFGDGLFTTIKVEEGQPQYLDAHLAKLKQQMDLFAIEKSIPQSLVFDFIRRNKLEGGRLKIIVTGGQEAELALPKRGGSLIIMAAPLPVIPKQITLKPIKAPLFPGKLLSYMPRLYLRELAKPCDDCLLLGEGGEILET
ncbi:MAG: aminotransferase class IV, partial [Chlamydiae bacterium]|nr:aminotransferase class IV [Chlamydiota bacterium]